ncbi:hypothetical protein QQ045_000232 [Rhodiola kirilowii]
MASSKVSALLFIVLLCISSVAPILACGSCSMPVNPPKNKTPTIKPPVHLPPVVVPVPLVTIPPVGGLPPIRGLPPVEKLPPVGGVLRPVGGLPPVGHLPPVTPPPVGGLPPVTVPPITKPGPTPCAPPPVKPANCPINILKFGACVYLLGEAVHTGVGDPAVNACCPVLKGLAELEAAACLCTTLKVKLLNLKVYVPIALRILISCGKTPPPGYTCYI